MKRKSSTITIKGPIPTDVLRSLGLVKTADSIDELRREKAAQHGVQPTDTAPTSGDDSNQQESSQVVGG